MYLRCTPGLAVASLLSAILVVWMAVDLSRGDLQPTVPQNVVIVATGVAWAYYLLGMRADAAREEREIAALVRKFKSE